VVLPYATLTVTETLGPWVMRTSGVAVTVLSSTPLSFHLVFVPLLSLGRLVELKLEITLFSFVTPRTRIHMNSSYLDPQSRKLNYEVIEAIEAIKKKGCENPT